MSNPFGVNPFIDENGRKLDGYTAWENRKAEERKWENRKAEERKKALDAKIPKISADELKKRQKEMANLMRGES